MIDFIFWIIIERGLLILAAIFFSAPAINLISWGRSKSPRFDKIIGKHRKSLLVMSILIAGGIIFKDIYVHELLPPRVSEFVEVNVVSPNRKLYEDLQIPTTQITAYRRQITPYRVKMAMMTAPTARHSSPSFRGYTTCATNDDIEEVMEEHKWRHASFEEAVAYMSNTSMYTSFVLPDYTAPEGGYFRGLYVGRNEKGVYAERGVQHTDKKEDECWTNWGLFRTDFLIVQKE